MSQARALDNQIRQSLSAKDASSTDEVVAQLIAKIASARKRKGGADERAQLAATVFMESSDRKRQRFIRQMNQPHAEQGDKAPRMEIVDVRVTDRRVHYKLAPTDKLISYLCSCFGLLGSWPRTLRPTRSQSLNGLNGL